MVHIVKSALVIAKAEDKSDVYLYRGAPVPSHIPAAEVARLVEGGFVEEVKAAEPDRQYPDGDPVDSWTVAQLTAWAADNGVEDVPAGPKPAVVEVVLAAVAARKE